MQIAYDDGGQLRELDIEIGNPSATVADLVEALDPSPVARVGGVRIGEHVVPLDHGLDECGLYEGAVVALVADVPRWPGAEDRPLVELHVVNGLEAGRRISLPAGVHVIGRDASAAVRFAAPTVSSEHALLDVAADGSASIRDLGSRNGTWIDGEAVVGSDRTVPIGATIRLGAIEAALRPPKLDDQPTGIDPVRFVTGGGVIPFNRSPREALPSPPVAERAPEGPAKAGRKIPIFGIATFAPLVTAAGLVAITGNLQYGLFAALSPIVAVFGSIERRRQGKRESRSDTRRFRDELAAFEQRLTVLAAAEQARRTSLAPDPAEITRRASLPSTRLWERVRGDSRFDDFLVLRAGKGDVPWDPPVVPARQPAPEVDAAIESASFLKAAPVLLELAEGGVVGIVGDRSASLALGRSLVCQAAVHHGPAELPIAICTGDDNARDWDWAKWLPHTRDASGATRMLAGTTTAAGELLASLVRARTPAEERRPGRPEEDGRSTVLVVLDDESLTEGRRAPARTLLRGGAGPVAGIVLAATADRLPAMCTSVVTLTGADGLATIEQPQRGERLEGFVAAGMDDATARGCAREMARFEDPELELVGAGLPDRVRLLPLLELGAPTIEAVAARWVRDGLHPRPEAPVGVGEDSVFTIDLVRDGPHGLVAGTTGAGKSELLRTLVVGLAASVDPDHLTFVLIDFKGGSAFDACSRLPHTVGMVTDLDQHLSERALRCLEAELRYRERVLRDAGATDLPEYQRAGTPLGPMPRLFVVVDEFATLKAELPDFVDSLVGVAQRGRSLGVHMLLATQRPSGAVNENIKANTNLRIALRVQDSGDSTDVIGVGDAAGIPRSRAGRAFVRLGPGEIVPIQTALSTATDALGEVAAVDAAPFEFGPTSRAAPRPVPTGVETARSDLELLVELIRGAFAATGRPAPRRPWPEPLPQRIDLDEILPAPVPGAGLPDEVVIALADDPDEQRQYATGWRPADGNVILYGLVGSGTTTAAATLSLALARNADADRCHLYVLDFGAGELGALAGLPHCGAVVGAAEKERQLRLIRMLRTELDRRRQLSAAERAGEPAIVTVIDGYAALVADYRDIAGQAVLDDLLRFFADGPEVGLYTVLTGDRLGSIPSAVSSLVRQKYLFRLADPGDYSIARIPARSVPDLPPGRAIVAETAKVVQVAMSAVPLTEAVAATAAAVRAPQREPAAVTVLPDDVALTDVATATRLDGRPWFVAIARRERDLGTAGLTVYPGEHAVVAGGARTGKTTTLAALAESMRTTDQTVEVVTVAGPRSTLGRLARPTAAFGSEQLAEALDVVEAAAGPVLLLVDDAEGVEDVGGRLEKLVSSGPPNLLVAAAGRPDVLRGMYNHWTRTVRRHKLGVLLQPVPELDGEVFSVNLPRRSPVAMVQGRGYLVNGGELELVQIARPANSDAGGLV